MLFLSPRLLINLSPRASYKAPPQNKNKPESSSTVAFQSNKLRTAKSGSQISCFKVLNCTCMRTCVCCCVQSNRLCRGTSDHLEAALFSILFEPEQFAGMQLHDASYLLIVCFFEYHQMISAMRSAHSVTSTSVTQKAK